MAREALDLLPETELEWSIVCFPASVDDFKGIAETFAGTDVRHVNVQPNVRPYTVLEAIPYVIGWLEVARDAGLTVYFETHRDRMTTDLRYTLQLIDAIPEMRLVADLSHFVVGEEFSWPIGEADEAMIPLGFPQSEQWVDLLLRWWGDGFTAWRKQVAAEEELVFVTELGPPGYAITGADGAELSDRWDEALLLKDRVREIWKGT